LPPGNPLAGTACRHRGQPPCGPPAVRHSPLPGSCKCRDQTRPACRSCPRAGGMIGLMSGDTASVATSSRTPPASKTSARAAPRSVAGSDTVVPAQTDADRRGVSGRSQTFADSTSKCLPRYATVPPAHRACCWRVALDCSQPAATMAAGRDDTHPSRRDPCHRRQGACHDTTDDRHDPHRPRLSSARHGGYRAGRGCPATPCGTGSCWARGSVWLRRFRKRRLRLQRPVHRRRPVVFQAGQD
jgi:hypothetical protein